MDDDRWCFSWIEGEGSDTHGKSRAALVRQYMWAPGDTIWVGWQENDPADTPLRNKVKKYASGWTAPKLANLTIAFTDNADDADVRISFRSRGSWSVLGTTCREIPRERPTMNFGWLRTANDEEARRVVLHEFGHALGLIHEHQNPGGTIPWNKEQVYRDLSGPPNSWDKATIDRNMFQPYDKNETNFTNVDPKSIMMYPIPAKWVTDPKYVAGSNSDLSQNDRDFIARQYPSG